MCFRDNPDLEERVTYLGITGLFLTLFTLFSLIKTKLKRQPELRPFDFVQLGLATYRLGRLFAYDKVAEPWRQPFTETKPDPSGAGNTVVPRGKGARRALGNLFSCPICTGTWVAAGLVYGLELLPGPTRTFVAIMGAIGFGELLNAATEALQWTGEVKRNQAGRSSNHNHKFDPLAVRRQFVE